MFVTSESPLRTIRDRFKHNNRTTGRTELNWTELPRRILIVFLQSQHTKRHCKLKATPKIS